MINKALLTNLFPIEKGMFSVDINNIISQLQQLSADFMENYCVINGNIWRIDQIEKMDLKEFADRSVYSLPLKFYKYFSDLSGEEKDDLGNVMVKNYSEIALETNEVFLNSPDNFDDVFDSEINISFDEFESPQAVLKREVKEKFGIYIEVGNFIETVEYDYRAFHLSMG